MNCKDIDNNVKVVSITYVDDCVNTNQRITDLEKYMKYNIHEAIVIDDDGDNNNETIIVDDNNDDDINKNKRKISNDIISLIDDQDDQQQSKKQYTPPQVSILANCDFNIKPVIGKWTFNNTNTVLYKLHTGTIIHNPESVEMIAFDMDGTLISTVSGNVFPKDENDWKFWDSSVVPELKRLHSEGKYLAIISNQGAMKGKDGKINTAKVNEIQNKVDNIFAKIGIPFDFICSIDDDLYRKPFPGMWYLLLKLRGGVNFDNENSMYVGDAAGREKSGNRVKDFSDSDYKLAVNVGVPFQTPERFFLKSKVPLHNNITHVEMKFSDMVKINNEDNSMFSCSSSQELVLLCGPPASGKSTISRTHFQEYVRVNQDTLKTLDKCLKVATEHLDSNKNKSIIVDNTNLDINSREKWIKLANKYSIPIRLSIISLLLLSLHYYYYIIINYYYYYLDVFALKYPKRFVLD
jgi:polynucleotide 5'-kinase 3'-phosphatase